MRDLVRPRWIALHLLVAGVVAAFVALGFWQLGRLESRRAEARLLERRSFLPLARLEGAGPWRRVSVLGRYDSSKEVVLYGRAYKGRPGHHLLTPLLTDGGRAVIVDRGWVPFDLDGRQARPPAGPVRVSGVLFPSEHKSRFGLRSVTGGRVSRIDVAALARRLPYPSYPLYLHLTSQDPRQERFPLAVEAPHADLGPHLSYAIQWFLFSAAALTGYVVLLTRRKRVLRADRLRS